MCKTLIKAACLLALMLLPVASKAVVVCETCPPTAQANAVAGGITIIRGSDFSTVLPGQSVSECDTLFVLGEVSYVPSVSVFVPGVGNQSRVGAGFFGGTGTITLPDGSVMDVTPLDMPDFKVGPVICADAVSKAMEALEYTFTADDIDAGIASFTFYYAGKSLLGDCSATAAALVEFSVNIEKCVTNDECEIAECVPTEFGGFCKISPVECPNEDLCVTVECVEGNCVITARVSCVSEDLCVTYACDPETGECVVTDTVKCENLDKCVTYACDPETGACTVKVNEVECVNNDKCVTYACDPETGACTVKVNEVECVNLDKCVTYACEPTTGECTVVKDTVLCEEKDCFDVSCDPKTGDCVYVDDKTCFQAAGCTPGFWKNCTGQWTQFATGEKLELYFDFPPCIAPYSKAGNLFKETTLLKALSLQGGTNLRGAAEILLRAAVAGMLNATHNIVAYKWDLDVLIDRVQDALDSCDRDQMISLAAEIDIENNRGCGEFVDGKLIELRCLRTK